MYMVQVSLRYKSVLGTQARYITVLVFVVSMALSKTHFPMAGFIAVTALVMYLFSSVSRYGLFAMDELK